ncbi:hypothetical protein Tco_0013782 [Tanacetum coccineum]
MTTTTMITTNNRMEGRKPSGPMLLPQLKTVGCNSDLVKPTYHRKLDLMPIKLGAAPVARAPYRLAPSEMQELSNQLQELAD